MSESIVSRVRRLISGNVNDAVDAIETAASETVMREAIREVERALDEARSELGRLTTRRQLAQRHIAMTKAKSEELVAKAQFAVEQGRDDLAEAVIARQFDLEAQLPVLEKTATDAQTEIAELEQCIAALQGRHGEMTCSLAAFHAAKKEADVATKQPSAAGISGVERRSDVAHDAFNRALNTATGVPGVAKSDRDTAAKIAELDQVARNSKIAERLATLKSARTAA